MESTKPHGYWTKERCQEEALRYNTKSEFIRESVGAYTSSLKKGWLEEVCAHMIKLHKPDGYWTKDICSEEAKNTIQELNSKEILTPTRLLKNMGG